MKGYMHTAYEGPRILAIEQVYLIADSWKELSLNDRCAVRSLIPFWGTIDRDVLASLG